MAIWTWWPGDGLPGLPTMQDFSVRSNHPRSDVQVLTGLDAEEVSRRLDSGNACYVASLGETPVAYGWVARGGASIGEISVDFQVGTADRYLWDFVTLPGWRGRGLYPHLLQRILLDEGTSDHRCWIINAPENVASERGILKAGFRLTGDLAFARDGRAGIAATGDPGRAGVGALLLGVTLVQESANGAVSPCWICVMESQSSGAGTASCWPKDSLNALGCACGHQAAAVG